MFTVNFDVTYKNHNTTEILITCILINVIPALKNIFHHYEQHQKLLHFKALAVVILIDCYIFCVETPSYLILDSPTEKVRR